MPTKVCLVKAVVFPVVMYRCECWAIKKAEHQRSDAFELWCWRRLLRVPWTSRRAIQSILKEMSPEYSLEGLMLKLKLILWPPDAKNWLGCWERLKAGEEGNDRGQDGWMASPTQWIWFEQPVGVGNGQGGLACYSLWCRKESDSTEQLNWTDPHGISKPLSGMDLIFFSDWSTPLFHVHW